MKQHKTHQTGQDLAGTADNPGGSLAGTARQPWRGRWHGPNESLRPLEKPRTPDNGIETKLALAKTAWRTTLAGTADNPGGALAATARQPGRHDGTAQTSLYSLAGAWPALRTRKAGERPWRGLAKGLGRRTNLTPHNSGTRAQIGRPPCGGQQAGTVEPRWGRRTTLPAQMTLI